MSDIKGFTLVELAIVMTIIGLLIGGVIKGQQLMENAKVSAFIKQTSGYEAALQGFRDIYNYPPGDFPQARTRLTNCTASTACANGDGNYILGTVGGYDSYAWAPYPNGIATENVQFWKHLAAADLIGGVNPVATTVEWGETHPVSRLTGVFHVKTTLPVPGWNEIQGITIVQRNQINGSWQCGGGRAVGNSCTISPLVAYTIDRKVDDGVSRTGKIQTMSSNGETGCGRANAGTQEQNGYDITNRELYCDIFVKID